MTYVAMDKGHHGKRSLLTVVTLTYFTFEIHFSCKSNFRKFSLRFLKA